MQLTSGDSGRIELAADDHNFGAKYKKIKMIDESYIKIIICWKINISSHEKEKDLLNINLQVHCY